MWLMGSVNVVCLNFGGLKLLVVLFEKLKGLIGMFIVFMFSWLLLLWLWKRLMVGWLFLGMLVMWMMSWLFCVVDVLVFVIVMGFFS